MGSAEELEGTGLVGGLVLALVGGYLAFRGGRSAPTAPAPRGRAPAPAPARPFEIVPATPAPAPAPRGRVSDVGFSAAFWQPTIHRLIAAEFVRVSEPFAMKWAEIESGWNPAAVGDPGQLGQGSDQPAEIGLGQLYNPDDFAHLHAPSPVGFRFYAPAAAPLAAQYRAAQADAKTAIAAGDIGAKTAALARAAVAARQIQSVTRPLMPSEIDDQVRWTLLAKIADDMGIVDHVVTTYSLSHWSIPDYWKLVKAPHALPGILNQGMPAVVKKLGRSPSSWAEFRSALGMDVTTPGVDGKPILRFPKWVRALNACETCGNAVAVTGQATS